MALFAVYALLGIRDGSPLGAVFFAAGPYGVPMAWLFLKLYRSTEKSTLSDFAGARPARVCWGRLLALVVGLIVVSIGTGYVFLYSLSYAAPELVTTLISSPLSSTEAEATQPWSTIVAWGIGVLLAPVVEELIVRGVMFRRWSHKWGPVKGAVFSSLVFGLAHGDVLGKFFFGLVMCTLAVKTRGLWVPVLAHGMHNAIAYLWQTAQHVSSGPGSDSPLDDFRSALWVGVAFFVVGAPWAIYYGRGCLRALASCDGAGHGNASPVARSRTESCGSK